MMNKNIAIQILVCLLLLSCNSLSSTSLPEFHLEDVVWGINFSEDDAPISQPKIDGALLYVQSNSSLFVYSIETGKLVWSSSILIGKESEYGPLTKETIVFYDKYVIVQSQRNTISVFNKYNGQLIWASAHIPGFGSFVDDTTFIFDFSAFLNKVYVSRLNTSLAAYDLLTGKVFWISSVPSRTQLVVLPAKNEIIVGTYDSLEMYNSENGDKTDVYVIDGEIEDYIIDGDMIYMSYDEGVCNISSYNLEKKESDWCAILSPSFQLDESEMVLAGDDIYVFGQGVVAVNQNSGEVNWRVNSQKKYQPLSIQDEVIYVSENGAVSKMLRSSGDVLAKINLPYNLQWKPVISNNFILMFGQNEIKAFVDPTQK